MNKMDKVSGGGPGLELAPAVNYRVIATREKRSEPKSEEFNSWAGNY